MESVVVRLLDEISELNIVLHSLEERNRQLEGKEPDRYVLDLEQVVGRLEKRVYELERSNAEAHDLVRELSVLLERIHNHDSVPDDDEFAEPHLPDWFPENEPWPIQPPVPYVPAPVYPAYPQQPWQLPVVTWDDVKTDNSWDGHDTIPKCDGDPCRCETVKWYPT